MPYFKLSLLINWGIFVLNFKIFSRTSESFGQSFWVSLTIHRQIYSFKFLDNSLQNTYYFVSFHK